MKAIVLKTLTLSSLFSVALATGCYTPYQSKGYTGGYDEVQLAENVFRVSFEGNGYTRMDRATNLCLLRCAELTLTNGFKYFSVVTGDNSVSNSTFTTPGSSITTGTYNQSGSTGTVNAVTTNYGGQTHNISKPSSSNTIVCYKVKPSGFVYEAQFIYKSLGLKYGLLEEVEVK
jgi:O-acetylhomoserine/O-acetylserine sulfhydrylase-like pyridoxal-dependent enzyme